MIEGGDSTVIELLELHPQEIELLKAMRTKWQFGEITIMTRNGLPFRMRRVTEFIDLPGKTDAT